MFSLILLLNKKFKLDNGGKVAPLAVQWLDGRARSAKLSKGLDVFVDTLNKIQTG